MSVTTTSRSRALGLDRTTRSLVAVLGSAAFLAVLDGSAVTASLETLSTTFGSPLAVVLWTTTGYLMAAGAVLPLVGPAIDRYGGRRVFLLGLVGFVLTSALTGLAWSVPSLLAFRVLQGLAGGILEPAAIAVAAAAAPRAQVGRVMGRFSLMINIAPVLGPLLGTLLADQGWWRAIFLVNLPLGAAILVAALRIAMPGGGTDGPRRASDPVGIALLTPAFVLLLFALNRWGAGAGAGTIGTAGVAGFLLLAGYTAHALRTPRSPVLDLRLLRIPAFAAALAVMATVGFTMYTQLSVLPIVAETRFALHGPARGVLVSALGLGLLVSMSTASRLSDRWGPRPLVVSGALVNAGGLAVEVLVYDSWPLAALAALQVAIGLGFGAVAAPSFAAVYRILAPEAATQGTTALFVTVQLFASLGVTVLGLTLDAVRTYGPVFAVLAGAAVAAAAIGTLLPGRADA